MFRTQGMKITNFYLDTNKKCGPGAAFSTIVEPVNLHCRAGRNYLDGFLFFYRRFH